MNYMAIGGESSFHVMYGVGDAVAVVAQRAERGHLPAFATTSVRPRTQFVGLRSAFAQLIASPCLNPISVF